MSPRPQRVICSSARNSKGRAQEHVGPTTSANECRHRTGTKIDSVLLEGRSDRGRSGGGEDEGAVVGDGDGVLGVGGVGAVGGAQRPAVGVDLVVAAAGGQHRLDGEGHAGAQRQPAAGTAPVGDGRVLVHAAADAVAAEVARHRVGAAVSGGDGVDGVADVAEPVAGCGGGDARFQGAAGGVDEGLVGGAGRADGDAEGGVARPAVEVGAAVDAEQVAVAQPVAAGDAVDDGVVDRDADDGGVGGGGEGGPVAEEGGFGARLADDGGGQLVEFGDGDAGGGVAGDGLQGSGDDAAGFAHGLEFAGGFQLNHGITIPVYLLV